jgi:hypothetical protein
MKCTVTTKNGSMASTPSAAQLIDFSGGFRHESVAISTDELKQFKRLLEMGPSSSVLAKGRDDLTACREAAHHGLRIMAFLADKLEVGEDPVQLVAKMAIAFGMDVDPETADWCDPGHGEFVAEEDSDG